VPAGSGAAARCRACDQSHCKNTHTQLQGAGPRPPACADGCIGAPGRLTAYQGSVGFLGHVSRACRVRRPRQVIPTVTKLCDHIGVSSAAVGFIIGCSDVATIPGTLGARPPAPALARCPALRRPALPWPTRRVPHTLPLAAQRIERPAARRLLDLDRVQLQGAAAGERGRVPDRQPGLLVLVRRARALAAGAGAPGHGPGCAPCRRVASRGVAPAAPARERAPLFGPGQARVRTGPARRRPVEPGACSAEPLRVRRGCAGRPRSGRRRLRTGRC